MPHLFSYINQSDVCCHAYLIRATALRWRKGKKKCTTAVHPGWRALLCYTPCPSVTTFACLLIAMLEPNKFLEDLGARLSALLAASPAADLEKNARTLLASGFAKLDLVSREEFDIQTQVLQRTREKLTALEARLDRLENPPDQPA